MTSVRLIRATGLVAIAAGLLFVAIQPMHPADTLGSVTTDAWALIHYATLVMLLLFLVGILGIYARQVEETGWLGIVGLIVLSLGLLITAALAFVEAFIEPLLADSGAAFVEGLLGMVEGSGSAVDLGPITALWAVSSVLFPLGCLLFGVAVLRARILPRWAPALFAVGLPVAAILVALLPYDLRRVGAMPIGIGLAGMGYAIWTEKRQGSTGETSAPATLRPREPAA